MKQPITHAKAHPSMVDPWNPYTRRDSCTPRLDDRVFDILNRGTPHVSPALFMSGCLDAPDEIPGGSTMSVTTVGKWMREEYHKLPRECDDYAGHLRAQREVGEMLRKIMGGTFLEDDES